MSARKTKAFRQHLKKQARTVRVEVSDHLPGRTWLAVEASFSILAVDLTPAQARRVARALLRFADGAR